MKKEEKQNIQENIGYIIYEHFGNLAILRLKTHGFPSLFHNKFGSIKLLKNLKLQLTFIKSKQNFTLFIL